MLREMSRQQNFDQNWCGVWGKTDQVSCVLFYSCIDSKVWKSSIELVYNNKNITYTLDFVMKAKFRLTHYFRDCYTPC